MCQLLQHLSVTTYGMGIVAGFTLREADVPGMLKDALSAERSDCSWNGGVYSYHDPEHDPVRHLQGDITWGVKRL